jgi:crossover junction endodeoxyribonuclease RuvC
MVILGIDPGTVRAGYGVVRREAQDARLVAAGTLQVPEGGKGADLLQSIRDSFCRLCAEHKPDMLAIEKLYFSKNRKTAMAVAEARGVILFAAKEQGLLIREYSPTEVKAGITGYGGADKRAVLKMVRLILRSPDLAVIDDASDALALALLAGQDLQNRVLRPS